MRAHLPPQPALNNNIPNRHEPTEAAIVKIIRCDSLDYIPASHEDPADPGVWKKMLLGRQDFIKGDIQMVNWAKLPAGRSFRLHYHEDMQEVFVIMKGTASITVDAESDRLEPGDAVVIPAGAAHMMEACGAQDVEYIALGISAGGHGATIVI